MSQRPIYEHAIVIVTMACNLKCKQCILCVPYYEKPWNPSTAYLKETTDRTFALGDYKIFEFNGGEPTLRQDLAELYDYTLRYLDRAAAFKTVTNGSVRLGDDVLHALKGYGEKFLMIVDDYGPGLSPFVEENLERLRSAGIPCDLRRQRPDAAHHGGWFDFRASEQPIHTKEEARQVYLRCGQAQKLKHCCNIIRGIMMPCHLQFQLNDRGICTPKSYEFIDLFDDDEPMDVKRAKLVGFQQVPALTACRWCNGVCDENTRYVPAAQLTAEEQKTAMRIEV